MSELKTKLNDASVEDFLHSVPDETRRKDALRVCELMAEVTNEDPRMWGSSIVGFGTFPYKTADGKANEWMKIGFSPRKANLTLYLMTGFDEYAGVSGYDPKPLLDKLGPYSTGKSCLYIKRLDDIDLSVLKQLVKESYDHMGV